MKFGDSMEILGEYISGTSQIEYLFHCSKHGDVSKSVNAKNILSKSFSPCRMCTSERQSESSRGNKRDTAFLLERLKKYCLSKGGKLVTENWTRARDIYAVDCGIDGHPNFFAMADSLISKPQWCPYCSGRKGNFEAEIREIINSKNGTLISEYTLSNQYVEVKCNEHNYHWDISPMNIRKGRWCPICNLPHSEKVVYDYLNDSKQIVRVQYGFDELVGKNNEKLRYDIALLGEHEELLALIEIDDDEHRHNHKQERRIKARERDEIKDKYCRENNIKLFRLEYYSKRKEFKDYEWYYDYIHSNLSGFIRELKYSRENGGNIIGKTEIKSEICVQNKLITNQKFKLEPKINSRRSIAK